MSFDEVRLRRNGSSVIQAMLKRLAEEEEQEGQEKRPVEDLELEPSVMAVIRPRWR